jgi:integrase
LAEKHHAQHVIPNKYIPEVNEIEREIALWGKLESDMTTEEIVLLMARSALINRDIINPVTAESLWDDYYQYKSLHNRDKKEVLRLKNRWQAFSSFIGVQILSANSYTTDIRPALKKYIDYLTDERQVSTSTIDRYLNDILAIINYGNEKHEFDWRVTKPLLPKFRNKERLQYPIPEQITIVEGCLAQKGHKALVACSILLYLQGAMMPSEVKRLRAEDIYLDKEYPFLVVSQETKTKARKRVVPITVGLQFIREHIAGLKKWLNKTSTDNCSRQMKIMLAQLVPHMPGQTAHCLRHSFRHNSIYSNANQANTALIAGWSGAQIGLSERMLRYGMGDMLQSEIVQGLYMTSLEINSHLTSI